MLRLIEHTVPTRQSIFNGIGLLSNLSRRTQFIDDVLLANDKALETGTRKLF